MSRTDADDGSFVPDTDAVETALTRSYRAPTPVSIYAAGLRFDVPPLLQVDVPAWFESVDRTLSTAVEHARTWMDDLCGRLVDDVPHTIVAFNQTFQVKSDELVNLLTQISMSEDGATEEQRDRAVSLLQALSSGASAQLESVRNLHGRVVDTMDDFQSDHGNLVKARRTITDNMADGEVIIEKVRSQLGDDFLDDRVQSPCNISVSLKASIELRVKETVGDHPEILPFVLGQALVEKVLPENERATTALSSVLTVWKTLESKLSAIVGDLKQAELDQVAPILEKLDVQTAQRAWSELQTFVSTLGQTKERDA